MKRKITLSLVILVLAWASESRAQGSCGWSSLTLGAGMDVQSLEVWNNGTGPALFAGAVFQQPGMMPAYGVKWDGNSWTPLGDGLNNRITCMAVFDDGTGSALFAGGPFFSAGGIPMSTPLAVGAPLYGIAKWDGTAWSPVGSGFTTTASIIPGLGNAGSVGTLTVFDDGTGPALYAGGDFQASGGVSLPGWARWDGNSWSPVPTGMGNSFNLLGVFDIGAGPALYAAMHSLPGIIHRWDGTTWVPLGAGVSGLAGAPTLFGSVPAITSSAVFDDGSGPALYAAGAFDLAGGIAANGIARWDGSAWSALGNGLGFGQNGNFQVDSISSLAVHDDGTGPALFAGGHFSLAGNNIMKWDGTSWSNMSGGLNGMIGSLKVFDDGNGAALHAAAEFFLPPPPGGGGTAISPQLNVAKWACASGLGLTLLQAEGIGSAGGVYMRNYNLVPGREYYNIFSVDLCPAGVGTGPYGGLFFSPGSIQLLSYQLLLPLGALPFHFSATSASPMIGPYSLPPITIEGACFEINAGAIGAISPAVRFTVQ